MHGEFLPEGPEILSIAGTLGAEAYSTIGLPAVDPELMKVYHAFSHLHGEFRSRLAQALWEAQTEMSQKGVTVRSEEAKSILSQAFKKWGFEASLNQ